MPPIGLNKQLFFWEAQQQGHQEFDMWDRSSEGSCRQTTTPRGEDRRQLTAKEPKTFDKETEEFFKNYKSLIGSESGLPSLILFV